MFSRFIAIRSAKVVYVRASNPRALLDDDISFAKEQDKQMTMAAPVRAQLIEQAACDTARAWAASCGDELVREARRVEGGWPGTLPEARMRASTHVGGVLAKRLMPALTHDELGRLARITYDEARRSWRTLCERP